MVRQLSTIGRAKQFLISIGLIIAVSAGCFAASAYIEYRVIAFILLLTVSLIATVFDIFPVLIAALLSALTWNFFFIPPKFTFHIGTAEDGFLFLMYFIIALINAILTNRIRKIEKEGREKEEKAKTVKLYNTLLSSLSHELKTPIATIVGATDNLLDEKSNLSAANREELAENISVAALRLNQQVENLLSMSRLESGFIQPKKDWCDINELIHAVINRLEQQLKNHRLQITVEETLPLYKLDFVLMEQVLYNLLYNASIYTPEYSDIFIVAKNNADKIYTLSTSVEVQSEVKKESNYLSLIIEDRGPGFPKEEVKKVFDKFYRLSNSKTGGTGLGLSIVKGFVEAHLGTIVLENVPHGAKFTIEIPAETSYINNLKMNNAAILVIDDEVQIRRLLEITLETNQFNVESANTAKEGLRIAASHPPDLIILDLGLPDESGHIVLKKLREWYTKPVLILSVQSSEEDIIKALDNGANDYLVKPFRTGELLARIRSALRSNATEDNNPVIDCGALQIDLSSRIVKKNNELIKLTATEYKLLSLFAQQEGKVLTHQYLLREIWGPGYINQSQYLRVFIAQLRKKIETDANRPAYIITESGVGYRFIAKEE